MSNRKKDFYIKQDETKPRELPGVWRAYARSDNREVETFETMAEAREWIHGSTDKPEED